MGQIDRTAIDNWGVAGLYLMERAGEASTNILLDPDYGFDVSRPVVICGGGNNGGDGLVVVRRLLEHGTQPRLFLTDAPDRYRGEGKVNLDRVTEAGLQPTVLKEDNCTQALGEALRESTVVVDAILGTGISGSARGVPAEAIERINAHNVPVFSIDVPSGVIADTGAVEGPAVDASVTVTFGLPKVGHFLPPGIDYRGSLAVRSIGFPSELIREANCEALLLEPEDIRAVLPRRRASSHKGTNGHLCVIAGSRGMSGAALLCAQAAYAAGAGLVTLALPASLLPVAATAFWEALQAPLPETADGTLAEEAADFLLENAHRFAAAVIGPGLSQNEQTVQVVRRIVRDFSPPLLIDADGLNALEPDHLRARQYPWAASPHPGEMARLMDADSAGEIQSDRWGWARRAADTLKGPIALKGPGTVIASPETPLAVNPTGGPEMASGGMGDVLSGLVGGLMAQGLSPLDALSAGVYLHGLAADLVVEHTGYRALLAGDVGAMVQEAITELLDGPQMVSSRRVDSNVSRST